MKHPLKESTIFRLTLLGSFALFGGFVFVWEQQNVNSTAAKKKKKKSEETQGPRQPANVRKRSTGKEWQSAMLAGSFPAK